MDEQTGGQPAAGHLEWSDIGCFVLERTDIALTGAVGTSEQNGEAGQDSWEVVRGEVL